MPEIIEAGSIQLDTPKSNLKPFDIKLVGDANAEEVAQNLVSSKGNTVPAGSIQLDTDNELSFRQGKETSFMDRVLSDPTELFNMFQDPAKEKAKAFMAVVNSEDMTKEIQKRDPSALPISLSFAYDNHNALNKHYDIDPIRKKRREDSFAAIQKFNDTGIKDDYLDTFWKSLQRFPPSMQEAAGGIIQAIEEDALPLMGLRLAGKLGIKEAENLYNIAKAQIDKKEVLSVGRDIIGAGAKQKLNKLGHNVMPGSFQESVAMATESTINNLAFLIPGFAYGKAIPLAMMGLQSGGQSYVQQREGGMAPDTALVASVVNGLAEAGTEFIPMGIYLKPGSGLVKRLIEAEFSEIPTEIVNQMINDVVDKTTIRPDMTIEDAIDNIQQTIQVTALSAGALTGFSHSIHKAIAKTLPPDQKETFGKVSSEVIDNGGTAQEAAKRGIEAVKSTPEGKVVIDQQVEKMRQETQSIKQNTEPFILGVQDDNGEVTGFTMADPVSGKTFEVPVLNKSKDMESDQIKLIPDPQVLKTEIAKIRQEDETDIDSRINKLVEGDEDVNKVVNDIFGSEIVQPVATSQEKNLELPLPDNSGWQRDAINAINRGKDPVNAAANWYRLEGTMYGGDKALTNRVESFVADWRVKHQPAATAEGKQPWTMTKNEYEAEYGKPRGNTTVTGAFSPHKEAVATQINRGKPVPPEVLNDYPDLQKAPDLATEARKYKSAEEFWQADHTLPLESLTPATTYEKWVKEPGGGLPSTEPNKPITVIMKDGKNLIADGVHRYFEHLQAGKENIKVVYSKSQLTDIWNKAQEGKGKPAFYDALSITTDPEVMNLILSDMKMNLEGGTKGGNVGVDAFTGENIYAGSGYPDWVGELVKKYSNKKTAPILTKTEKAPGIDAARINTVLTKGQNGDTLTRYQQHVWEDLNVIADRESGKSYAPLVEEFNRVTKGEDYANAERQLAEEGIDASAVGTNKESIIASLGKERDITPAQEAAAYKELDNFFSEVSKGEELKGVKESLPDIRDRVPERVGEYFVLKATPEEIKLAQEKGQWWVGRDFQKEIEAVPVKYWEIAHDPIRDGYVPITYKEQLYLGDKFPGSTAQFDLKPHSEMTGDEGLFMKPKGLLSYGKEAQSLYKKFQERYYGKDVPRIGGDTSLPKGMPDSAAIRGEGIAEKKVKYKESDPRQPSLEGLSPEETFTLNNPTTEISKPLSEQATPKNAKLFDVSSILNPVEIVNNLKGLTSNIKEAMPHLEALGRQVYQSGKTNFNEWSSQMKETLGDLWDSFKEAIKNIWANRAKWVGNEIGAIGNIESEQFKATIKELREINNQLKGKVYFSELNRESLKERYEKLRNNLKWMITRKETLKNVSDYFGLTDTDMSKISKKNPLLMDEQEFSQYLKDVNYKAVELADNKWAKIELMKLVEEKRLQKVDNYRKALKLPSISEMTTDQLRQFAKLLEPFQDDDIFLTQRELETVDKTDLKGIKTWREAREKLAQEAGVPIAELSKVKVLWNESYKWDSALREQDPFFDLLVTKMTESMMGAEMKVHNTETFIYDLVKKSESSRKRGLVERAIPQDEQIFAYLEAPQEEKAAVAQSMTPEQLNLAHFMNQYFSNALDYLLAIKSVEKGRENYITHVRKSFFETVRDKGIKEGIGSIFTNAQEDQMGFNILDDDTGNILPLEKFFQFSMHRTGELQPTKNVVKAFMTYVQMFEKKRAFDAIIPKLDIYTQSLTPTRLTARGLEFDQSLKKFVKKWINNKKGRKISYDSVIRQGGPVDLGIRSLKTFTSMVDLGFYVPAQIINFAGEQLSTIVPLGVTDYVKSMGLMRTEKGQRILKKYEFFTGRSLWEEFTAPGKEVTGRLMEGMFGFFHISTVAANKQFLLASMTKEEYANEELSPERLAQMKLDMGRFRAIPGTNSLVGSTSIGGSVMQYKTWAVPITRSVIKDITTMAKNIKGKEYGDAFTSKEAREIYRIVGLTTAVIMVSVMGGEDEDDSFVAKMKARTIREFYSLTAGMNPVFWTSWRSLSFLTQLAKALTSLTTMEEYKTKEGLKGIDQLKKTVTPGMVRALPDSEED